MFFNRIDRYIAFLFGGFFLGGLLVFMTMFLALDAMSTMVSYDDVTIRSFIKFYVYYTPEIVYRMTPVSCLFATIFTLSTLNRNNELVALFASGMSLFRITTPILVLVAILCGMVFVISDRVMPNFARLKNYVFYHEIKKNPSLYSMIKNERIWYRSKDTIFNIKTLNERTHRAQGLTLYYFDDNWDLLQMITATEVELLGQNWLLKEGSVTLFTKDSSFPLTSQFKTKKIVMGEDSKDLSSTAHTSDVLSLAELSDFIKKNKEAGLDTIRYEVDYHSKYGFSLAALVMSLLGIPFSVGKARSGGVMASVGVCLGLVFLYWIFYSSSLTLGNYGHIPAIVAAWFPNISMSMLAFYFIYQLKK